MGEFPIPGANSAISAQHKEKVGLDFLGLSDPKC